MTLEVEGYGHDFTIKREDEYGDPSVPVSTRLQRVIAEAEASMVDALTAVPGPRA